MAEGSFDWTGLGALGTGIGALGSMATSFMNYGLSSKNFDYQKELQNRVFAREDTSLQRRMQDAKAAGLNPYSVINSGGASSGNVVRTEAPQMNLNTNGLIDTVNSILDIKQRQEQTKSLQLDNVNKEKSGLILDADLAGKDWQNKILGLSFSDAQYDNFQKFLQTERIQNEFNYDFNRGIVRSGPYGDNLNYGYNEVDIRRDAYSNPRNPYEWQRKYERDRAMYSANMGYYDTAMASLDHAYMLKYGNELWENDIESRRIRNQLMSKENAWYNWNQGFDMVTGAVDAVSGLLFKGLDLGLRKAEGKSRTRLNNARSYQIYGENSGYYWDWNY